MHLVDKIIDFESKVSDLYYNIGEVIEYAITLTNRYMDIYNEVRGTFLESDGIIDLSQKSGQLPPIKTKAYNGDEVTIDNYAIQLDNSCTLTFSAFYGNSHQCCFEIEDRTFSLSIERSADNLRFLKSFYKDLRLFNIELEYQLDCITDSINRSLV